MGMGEALRMLKSMNVRHWIFSVLGGRKKGG